MLQNFIQGTQINHIGTKDELILELAKMMMDSQVIQNKELVGTIIKAIDKGNKNDKKGLLENLKTISDLGSTIVSISTKVPELINFVHKLFA